jgi:hypothetical protein
MTRNYYSEINLHIAWHTKASFPLLTPEVEAVAYRSLRPDPGSGRCSMGPVLTGGQRCENLGGRGMDG